MEKEPRLFRKAAFGGFNKEDVVDYISNMKREFAAYKNQVEETMETLNEKIAHLEQTPPAPPATEAEVSSGEFEVDGIAAATERLREVGDTLCSNLNSLIERLQNAPAAVASQESVYSMMQGLLAAQGKKAEPLKAEFVQDAALVESVLPAYLR